MILNYKLTVLKQGCFRGQIQKVAIGFHKTTLAYYSYRYNKYGFKCNLEKKYARVSFSKKIMGAKFTLAVFCSIN